MARRSKNRPPAKRRSLKVLNGDRVIVISGAGKGATGTVEPPMPAEGRLRVQGVTVAARHQAPTAKVQQGGIIDKTMPVDASNVAVISPTDGRPTRVGYRITTDGQKVRICKRTRADL